MAKGTKPRGITVFTMIWFGQMISLIGSSLTGFALGVWVYQLNGSVTQFTLISLFTTVPGILISPLAGAFVDHWNRRWVMIVSDSGAGLSTLVIAALLFTNYLAIWQIYLALTFSSICSALQWSAYPTIPTLLVPRQHFARANGMIQFGRAVAQLISPMLGGVLLIGIQIQGVLLLDFATFLFSLSILLVIQIPQPKPTAEGQVGKGALWREATYGWIYIRKRPGLLGLVLLSFVTHFLTWIVHLLATPMVLAFASASTLGMMLSIGGSGMLIGSVVMSLWGGPKRRIHGMFGFQMVIGVCILLSGLRPSVILVTVTIFTYFFCLPFINACLQAIWQNKVVPDLQGRVFAVRRMVSWSSLPLSYLVAGPFTEKVFEPLLAVGGPLAGSIGQIIGVGSGRGIALLFITIGLLTMLATTAGYLYAPIRLIEDQLPNIKISVRRNG